MLVKDEQDVIGPVLHHLAANVDLIIVADNLSTDATPEILRDLAADGLPVEVRLDEEVGYYQAEKTTALALEAYRRGFGWVVPCDADEVWLTSDGRTLTDYLDGVPLDTQIVRAAIYNHVATAADDPADRNPLSRLGWRQRQHLDLRWAKVACRCRPDLIIFQGNHGARTQGTAREAYGLELRHYPYRTADQFCHKAKVGAAAYAATTLPEDVGRHWREYGQTLAEHGEEALKQHFLAWFYSHDPASDGSLVYDPAPAAEQTGTEASEETHPAG